MKIPESLKEQLKTLLQASTFSLQQKSIKFISNYTFIASNSSLSLSYNED